jgi:hypothetical protein
MKKLNKNMGVNIQSNEYSLGINGGSIFSSIKKSVNKATKKVSDTVNKATDKIKDTVDDVNVKNISKAINKADVGGYIEDAQNIVPQSVTTEAVKMALMAGGMDETSANIAASAAVGSFYEVDFSKNLKGQKRAAISGAAKGAAKGAIQKPSKSKETTGGALNSVQMKMRNGEIQENKDNNIRFQENKMRRNYNGDPLMNTNMVRQVAPSKYPILETRPMTGNSIVSYKKTGGSIVSYKQGGAINKKKSMKGTQEMKDRMQMLRDMKKGNSIKSY